MIIRPLLPFAAAAALSFAAPAAAQHGDHSGHGGMHSQKSPAGGILEASVKNGVRTVEMQVTDEGFVPSKIKTAKGEKLRLVVTRKTDRTCAKEIVVKDHGIDQKLPLDTPVTVELTPTKSGEIHYSCAHGHIAGIIFIP